MALPLEGLRVLELTAWMTGTTTGMILADMGAEVIKVEEPGVGDPSRGGARFWGVDVRVATKGNQDVQLCYEMFNRNKKAIVLNLKRPKAREVLYDLVRKSDVFIQNLRPGKAEQLGADYQTVSRHNPRLIYALATAYGTKGPDRGDPGQDTTASARSGLMFATDPRSPPQYIMGSIADIMTGTTLALGTMAALCVRERFGIGQMVDASLLGSALWLHHFTISTAGILGQQFTPYVRETAENPLMSWYRCGDGKWLCMGCLSSDKFWPDFCLVLGIENLRDDPKFKDINVRAKNSRELIQVLDKIFATKPRDEWLELFRKTESGVIATQLNNILEVFSDPQILANEYVVNLNHPLLGSIQTIGLPIKFSETPASIRTTAPEMGQHTEEVLTEVCGYSWEQIGELREEGVY